MNDVRGELTLLDLDGFRGETARLQLRSYATSDLAEHVDLHGRDDVARYLPWETRTQADCEAALLRAQRLRLREDNDGVTIAGFDKGSGRLVGEFNLFLRSVASLKGEVGYVIHPDFAGKGLATEGAGAMLQLGFDVMGMHRIIGRIDARNRASAAVLERLGMRHEAHLVENDWFKGEWGDEDDYAVLDREWANKPIRSLMSWTTSAPASASEVASDNPPA